ncbi:MAG: ATP synthase F1 subunit gamma [Bdellovibrionales bacterium]|nr:ATP synthase F1 subunit gamma [Bdellovibrionales bacterium]
MSQLKEIQSRIQGVKNTKQMTRAMKMISAVKLRKAQERILNLRAYADGILSTMADVALSYQVEHPLLNPKTESTKLLLVVLASDRGLCGSFNYNVCKKAEALLKDNEHQDYFIIGKKAVDYFKFRKFKPIDEISGLDREVSFPLAARVAQFLMDSFTKGNYDQISLIYQTFYSAVSQKVKLESFLPIDLTQTSWEGSSFSKDFIFETSPQKLVENLIQKHFATQIYRAMCESLASEHGARMYSMENAVKNATDIEKQLQLQFNKIRQSSITTELIEVSSGVEAMSAS